MYSVDKKLINSQEKNEWSEMENKIQPRKVRSVFSYMYM